jgi:hypothetical protein
MTQDISPDKEPKKVKRKKLYTEEDGTIHKSHPDEPTRKADKKEREWWKVMEIMPDTSNYSAYERMDAVAAYAATGKPKEVVKLTGIPYQTIIAWKNNAPWWKKALRELRKQEDDVLDARLTRMMSKSLDEMEDRLLNGDEIITKDGDALRRKVSFRDLSVAGVAVSFDKRALTRGEPTARIEKVGDEEMLKKLQSQFKQIAQARIINIPESSVEQIENEE